MLQPTTPPPITTALAVLGRSMALMLCTRASDQGPIGRWSGGAEQSASLKRRDETGEDRAIDARGRRHCADRGPGARAARVGIAREHVLEADRARRQVDRDHEPGAALHPALRHAAGEWRRRL